MKHFYHDELNEGTPETDEDTENDRLARNDSKNMKNNKNLLNQLFLNNAESSMVLTEAINPHRTDQIPLLYQAHFNHRKSIANLELTQAEFQFEKHKINRSEHDLLFQQKQQQFGSLLGSSGLENIVGQVRVSWDMNLDRVSTISN